MRTLDTWISDHARDTPDAPALLFDAALWTYADFNTEIDACAECFLTHGIRHGDRIAWIGQNHAQCLVALFACARLGALLVPLNWRLSAAEMQFVIDDATPSLLLCDDALSGGAAELTPPSTETATINVDRTPWRDAHGAMPTVAQPASAADALLIVYTSGTTGRPKGAVLTQHALTVNAHNSVHMHGLGASDHVLSVLPLFHVGGLNILTTPAFFVGASVELHRRFEPSATLQSFATGEPTLCVLVPATIHAVAADPAFDETPLQSLRMLTTGSSIVAAETLDVFESRGIPVVQVYGCTETGPVSAYQQPDGSRLIPGSTGRAAKHSRILIDDQGALAPTGTSGEIIVVGDHTLIGYWNNTDASHAVQRHGGFATGDIGYLDADGNLFVQDRARDLIISGGENVYPAEIERVLRAVDGVVDVAVTGAEDSKWGQVPVAWLIVDNNRYDPAAAKEALDRELARFKHPRDWHLVDEFPRNALGKVQKFKLRDTDPARDT